MAETVSDLANARSTNCSHRFGLVSQHALKRELWGYGGFTFVRFVNVCLTVGIVKWSFCSGYV